MADFDPSNDAFPTARGYSPDVWPARSGAPFRAASPPPPTLAERFGALEKRLVGLTVGVDGIRHDLTWLCEHWHKAIDRANEQLGDRVRPGLAPVWYWAAGVLTGVGFGSLALFGLARGWF